MPSCPGSSNRLQLDLLPKLHFTITDLDEYALAGRNEGVRNPVLPVNDAFYGFIAFPSRLVIAITDTHQLLAVLFQSCRGPVLAGAQVRFDFHVISLLNFAWSRNTQKPLSGCSCTMACRAFPPNTAGQATVTGNIAAYCQGPACPIA